ncbi:MAG: amidase [Pseudomonadota bacterium]|nr:amidase [Pseudomonadota bacterium]
MKTDPIDRPIELLAKEIRAGTLSPINLAEKSLARIRSRDDQYQSFIHVSESVLDDADTAEREIRSGNWKGPLHGIPMAVKDNYLTADMPTNAGTNCSDISFPQEDSNTVARLRAAGAVLVGKTRLHEFAWGTVTPPTRNPWDFDRVPGGSSGGSAAAVSGGLVTAAMGSDTGGSIRIPASLCGTVGLKPTFGRIGRSGIIPHSWSLDHAGPLTKTVADAAMILNVLAGSDPSDPSCQDLPVPDYTAGLGQPIDHVRIGVCGNHFFGHNQPDVENAVKAAIDDLAKAGCSIKNFQVPNLKYSLGAIFAIELASSTAYHDSSLQAGRVSQFEPDVRTLVEMGRLVSGPDYLKAEQLRRVLVEDFARVFDDVDVIITPATPLTAWLHDAETVEIAGGQESVLAASWRLTYPYNLVGLPAISIPCGFDRDGLPIGLQIAAKPFDEQTLLRVAHAYEQRHNWAANTPTFLDV